ncbi:alpha/beta-hydrolase [Exidia glandulosa HHB12029]|uniref:Dipeptidyl-peptidase V n=1 Tax=Exidia glandulosa HHB12029 TaxID=1314781 RepID=A0A165KXM3_EXIGL|nr:alpha/beta-hydrolase [Exidia glandulosa HHB12029]
MLPKPEAIAASDGLHGPSLSPDGSQVVYSVRPLYKAAETDFSASCIWIADTGKANSARRLTSGLFNDSDAVFSSDGASVLFLSDRHERGGPMQIYSLPLTVGGEAAPLMSAAATLKRDVQVFEASPDGRYIAFVSKDEPTAEDEAKERAKSDALVWSERRKDMGRLRLLRLATGTVSSFNLPADRHAHNFAWSADGESLIVCITLGPDLEHMGFEATYYRVTVRHPNAEPTLLAKYQDAFGEYLTWLADGTVLETRFYNPQTLTSALAVRNVLRDCATNGKATAAGAVYSGSNDDVGFIVGLPHDNLVAVEVISGVDSRIDIIASSGILQETVYRSSDDALGDQSWDIKRLEDGSYVFACIRSSGPRKEPSNVWAGKLDSKALPGTLTQLSSHNSWIDDISKDSATATSVFRCKARDGTDLDGIICKPTNAQKPLPAILIAHGGPYYRDAPSYIFNFCTWREFLAAHGFCVISPNYRGSSGRGAAFAETMYGGVGTVDWTDCEDMLQAVIDQGFADPERLGIAGWSQGGFMAAWGASQTKNKFKAAVMGAGLSDLGTMCEEAEAPEFEVEFAGGAPWTSPTRRNTNDPIRFVKDVETAFLILHGEKDQCVPVGQGIGFFRGLRRMSKFPERHELVIYPREGHGFTERSHVEDVLKRVLDHLSAWLT